MKIPLPIAEGFKDKFQACLAQFVTDNFNQELGSERFLRRSILPHLLKLTQHFNRLSSDKSLKTNKEGLARYWKESSNPENLRLAYFLSYMPPNLCRVASVWAELLKYGLKWNSTNPHEPKKIVELGSGPATGSCGLLAAETWLESKHIPLNSSFALIDSDRAILELGQKWSEHFSTWLNKKNNFEFRNFHQKLDFSSPKPLLNPKSPRFDIWISSFFLNELKESPHQLTEKLIQSWNQHLSELSLIILIEPALRNESRKLLEIRKEILIKKSKLNYDLNILLPCLGHQTCGALSNPEDWCHEEILWWRPPYMKLIDEWAKLDRKTLPFSYLVLGRSPKQMNLTLENWLPLLPKKPNPNLERLRLVSPVSKENYCFVCGERGKERVRVDKNAEPERGDIIFKLPH